MQAQNPRGPVKEHGYEAASRSRSHARNGSGLSRAEKFEDEKRRIIDSCFARRESDGSIAESYITHIRIVEDAASPSSPPPPSSPPENKNPRAIIVAVRKSGRVRLHKARENNNGTFSIGKTWVLDHLSAIESYTGGTPANYEEQQRQEWAGNTGVLITIQKPYFWQTVTSKEKDFFIGSLVKIYRKYTGGNEPLLSGFTEKELAEFSSHPQRSSLPQSQTPMSESSEAGARSTLTDYRTSDPKARNGDAHDFDDRPSSATSASTRDTNQERGSTSGFGTLDPGRTTTPSEPKTRMQALRKGSAGQSSRPDIPRNDHSARTLATESSVESFQSQPETQPPQAPFTKTDRFKPNGTQSPLSRSETPGTPPIPAPRSPERGRQGPAAGTARTQPPERKRPPLLTGEPPKAESGRATPASSFVTPNEGPIPAESIKEQQRPPSSKAAKLPDIVVPKSTFDYFSSKKGGPDEPEEAETAKPDPGANGQEGLKGLPSALGNLSSPEAASSQTLSPDDAEHRPGLGPMIKKRSPKEIASVFRKAATAHNAFKPRAGGAADKIKEEASKLPNTPDGINGVFRAPVREPEAPLPQPPPAINVDSGLSTPAEESIVEVSRGEADSRPRTASGAPVESPGKDSPEKKKDALIVPEERRVRRPSNNSAKFAKALGIDPAMLEGRTAEIETVLNDLGWSEADKKKKTFEDLHADLRRDLARVETGSWLGGFEQSDERIATVGRLLDKAIAECDELEGVLTLYNVELGTLSEDVAYIEAQSQGLQVQTANQKLLHSELKNLLQTISLSSSQLRILKESPINRPDGVEAVESALVQLYKALLTIDPKIRQQNQTLTNGRVSLDGGSSVDKTESEISTMRAVQERREGYRRESLAFIQRFRQFIAKKLQVIESMTAESIARQAPVPRADSKVDLHRRDPFRGELLIYAPFVLFAREIEPSEWDSILNSYESSVKRPYQEEFKAAIASWRSVAKIANPDEQENLFTAQEKEAENLVARKLTVKRSKTLRGEGPRNASGDKKQDGKIVAYEAFAGLLGDTTQAIFREQNFVVEMFHLSSLTSTEFADVVASTAPQTRRLGNLSNKKLFDPDRSIARKLRTLMDDVFSSWPLDIQNAVDWVLSQDPLQGIGVMLSLEVKIGELEDSNQEYLVQTLTQIHSRLTTRFDRFVEEQIHGIEDTKVKIKKRKGVIAFMKTFPYFASAIENILAAPHASHHEIRHLVNDTYIKINKAMFESLKFIAKESPVVMAGQRPNAAGAEAEDKEILNYHILLIENMNHYLEEVDVRGNPVLAEWKETALREMTEHLDLYLNAVVRRPLGKLLDFLESTESLLAAARAAGADAASIAERASHSRQTCRKLLAQFDAKEIGRGVEALKKRVVKHFGEADDPGLSQGLIARVLRECAERYVGVWDRASRVVREVYGGGLEIEWRRDEVQAMFRRA